MHRNPSAPKLRSAIFASVPYLYIRPAAALLSCRYHITGIIKLFSPQLPPAPIYIHLFTFAAAAFAAAACSSLYFSCSRSRHSFTVGFPSGTSILPIIGSSISGINCMLLAGRDIYGGRMDLGCIAFEKPVCVAAHTAVDIYDGHLAALSFHHARISASRQRSCWMGEGAYPAAGYTVPLVPMTMQRSTGSRSIY
jgi:hypothetical protein